MATSGDAERLRRLQLVTDAALAHLPDGSWPSC
jgi:hypothetical protein